MNDNITEALTIDVRALMPSHRHPVILAILDKLAKIRAPRNLKIITDHEPIGLKYELQMNKETQGHYRINSTLQKDGTWHAGIKWKEEIHE